MRGKKTLATGCLLYTSGEEEIIPGSPSAAPPEDGAKVLERTARTVGFHVVRALVGIFAIVMIWMVYLLSLIHISSRS